MVAALAVPLAGALGISTTTASIGLSIAAYAATTAASIYLQMSMAEEQKQDIGTKLSAVLGGAVTQAIHAGRKETAGSFIYVGTWGRSGKVPNAFLTRVYCLGDRPVDGFEDYIWGGGKKCNYDPGETQVIDGVDIGHPINAFDANGGHRLWVKFYDGTQTTADDYLVDKFGSDPQRAWTVNHIGRGRPYMIVTQKYDKKEPSGEVDVVAVVKNARYYDWRNDSTNGGSGSERYGNYATYSVDNGNPVRLIYNIMRGIYYGNRWLYGGQAWPASRFDNDSWTAAANKCDEDVALAGGGTQKRFRLGAEIDLSEEPLTVIERCLKACNGRLVESGGVFKIYVGGIGASVYSFTDSDVLVTEDLTGRLYPTREKIANTVTGTYVEPGNAGEPKAFKARFQQAYIDADGGERKTSVDYEYVRDNRQAQRLASMALNDNRRFRTFVVAFWTQARKLEPCDVVSWTSANFGFTNKKFIVGDVILRGDGVVIVNLREADANDANWSTSDEDEFELGVFDDIEVAPQSLTATVTAVPFTDDAGKSRRPAIRIQSTLDDDFIDCRALRYQVRKRFGDQKIIHREGRSEDFFDPDHEDYGDITFTSNAIAAFKNKQVQVRYKIEPESDRLTTWSDWADHTITLGDYGIDDDDTSDDLLAAPTGLSVTKVQQKDEDGTIRTFLRLDCTAPAWAGAKATYVYEVTVEDEPKPFKVKSDDEPARFRVNRTGKQHDVRVRAKSGVGQPSAWTSSISVTPSKKSADASAITGIAINRKNGSNVITWDRISDPDNREVAIMAGTTNVLASMTEIGRTKSTKWTDSRNIVKGTHIHYRLLPVDTSDNVGATASSSVDETETGIGTSDTDASPLSAPTGISLTQANRDVDRDGTVDIALLSTFSGGVSGAAGYEVEFSDNAGQIKTERADSGKFWFPANTQRSYRVRWRTINWVGQPGSWSSYVGPVTPAAASGAPPNPTSVSASTIPQGFSSTWTAPTVLDYAFTEIAIGNSGAPTSNVLATTSANTINVFHPSHSSLWIWVRHVNTSDLRSSWVRAGSAVTPGESTDIGGLSLGTSSSGVATPGSFLTAAWTLSWICDNSASGVDITVGSRTYNNLQFAVDEPMSLSFNETTPGTTIGVTKTGGQWRSAFLQIVTNTPGI